MTELLGKLSDADLRTLATALRSGRLSLPLQLVLLQRIVPATLAVNAADGIDALARHGLTGPQIAAVLEFLIRDRSARSIPDGAVDLVTSGPDGVGANRDTGVVVRELFANATESVLVAGYAVYQGLHLFEALAERMRQIPDLQVSMFLDIQRAPGDSSDAPELVRRFTERFKGKQWPQGAPVPKMFYDPRSLDMTQEKRACMHAKCVVVDCEKVLVSSANFTEAAQLRNIEVGVLLNSSATANQITIFFHDLLSRGLLSPIL